METIDVFDSPALPLVLSLTDQGFRLSLTPEGRLHVAPGSKLTGDQRQQLRDYKDAVLRLVRCLDDGVVARRDAFRARIEAAERVVLPALVFAPDVPYAAGTCFSCGDPNGRPTHGRCWRCSLAWRLACRVPIPSDLALVVDQARQVA